MPLANDVTPFPKNNQQGRCKADVAWTGRHGLLAEARILTWLRKATSSQTVKTHLRGIMSHREETQFKIPHSAAEIFPFVFLSGQPLLDLLLWMTKQKWFHFTAWCNGPKYRLLPNVFFLEKGLWSLRSLFMREANAEKENIWQTTFILMSNVVKILSKIMTTFV